MSSSFQNYLTKLASKRYDEAKERIQFQNTQIACNNWQTCFNCSNFEKENCLCKFYNAVVPVHVAIVGCQEYNSDIPF